MPDEAPSLRETLESAIEEHSAPEQDAVEPAAAPETAAPVEAKPEEAVEPAKGQRDEQGRFKPAAKPAPAAKDPAAPAPVEAKPETAQAAAPVARAPSSWKPAMREKWGALPPEVQSEVLRVDRETSKVLQENAQLRQTSGAFQQLMQPYENNIRARGQEPQAFVGSLLQTEHALSTAPAPHKADIIAQLCMQYGIEPQHLDRALAARLQGQPMPQQAQPRPQEFHDPRFDQFLAQAAQRQESESVERVASFADSHEFYADIMPAMADLIEVWGKQGKKTISEDDMERAYAIACRSDEGISKILEGRKATDAARAQAPTVQRSKLAASSVRASPGASATRDQGPRTLRETIEAAVAGQRT